MRILLTYILVLFIVISCKKEDPISQTTDASSSSHIQLFGFTLIDTYWDDPSDSETKTNYAGEVYSFSNIADILVVSPTDNIVSNVSVFNDYEMKALLHLNELFFELVDTDSPSGANYDIRSDFVQRWDEFKASNLSVLNENSIGAFYIGEEPTWNGISFSELNDVTELLKADFPSIPILVIEAYPSLNDLQVPALVDWIGFDRYFIKDPNSNTDFQEDWQILKTKLSSPSQKIMVIMDSHYIDWAHGDFGNIALEDMHIVANNYYTLAKNDERVIGILGYFWPSGFDVSNAIGARGMPEHVKAKYSQMGKEITGK